MDTLKLILFLKCHIIILRFLNCSDKWTNEMKSHIDQLITYYVQKPNPIEGMETIITHITVMQSVSKKDQLKMSNSISNYHWIDYPRFKKGKGQKDNSTRYSSHLLWFPKDRDRRNHLPTSSRLQVMQFYLFEEEYKDSIGPLVTQLVQRDKGEEITDYVPPLKRRKKTKHTSTHSSTDTKFSEHMLTEGNMKWCFHDEGKEICMMNGVDKETGVMKPNLFVHVTYTTDANGEIILTYTCKIFDFICQTVHQHNPIWPLEDTIPDISFTCLHCMFF